MIHAVDHLPGATLPNVALPATDGRRVDLSTLPGTTIVYIYTRTAPPDGVTPPGWDQIPGARSCTPQSLGFRDQYPYLRAAGAEAIFGLSTQDTPYQREAAKRLCLPFPLLSDAARMLQRALDLPVFVAGGMVLLARMTLIVRHGRIAQVFHPITDPGANAEQILWTLTRDQATT